MCHSQRRRHADAYANSYCDSHSEADAHTEVSAYTKASPDTTAETIGLWRAEVL